MKKVIFILTIISSLSWAHTYKCLYMQQGVNRTLTVEMDLENGNIELAKYTPYGIRYQTYSNAEVYEDHDFLHIVWDQADTEQFEITVKKTGAGLLNFIKSIHGPHIVEVRCESPGIGI